MLSGHVSWVILVYRCVKRPGVFLLLAEWIIAHCRYPTDCHVLIVYTPVWGEAL